MQLLGWTVLGLLIVVRERLGSERLRSVLAVYVAIYVTVLTLWYL